MKAASSKLEAVSCKEEKANAFLLSDGHPSPLGEGPGVRGFHTQTTNHKLEIRN